MKEMMVLTTFSLTRQPSSFSRASRTRDVQRVSAQGNECVSVSYTIVDLVDRTPAVEFEESDVLK